MQEAMAPLLTAVSQHLQRCRRAAHTPQIAAEWRAELYEEETPHPHGATGGTASGSLSHHQTPHFLEATARDTASVTGLPAGCSGSQAAATEDSTDPVPPHSSTCHWRGVRGSAGGRGAPARTSAHSERVQSGSPLVQVNTQPASSVLSRPPAEMKNTAQQQRGMAHKARLRHPTMPPRRQRHFRCLIATRHPNRKGGRKHGRRQPSP